MSSATKALELLTHFSLAQPEIGLSQLCRMVKRDKATTYRHLQALETVGFVEQNPMTRHYRLGPALLQLAQTREATVPRKAGAQLPLTDLANATGETAHVAVLSGTTLYTLLSCESPTYSTRAIIDVPSLPLHATATGLCALAFGPDTLFDAATRALERFTDTTPITPEALARAVACVRDTGFGHSQGCFEAEIVSFSAPIFDYTGQFAGAVAVACVGSRFTPDLELAIKTHLISTSRVISHNWGGTLPAHIEGLWSGLPSYSEVLDTTP